MERRSTIIFGNGLGMALSPDYFGLKPAMASVWNNDKCLSENQKRLVRNCIQAQGAGEQPTSENDLDILHMTVNACEFLDDIAVDDDGWLTNDGKDFPLATKRFLTNVAWYFHNNEFALPDAFIEPLFEFIKNTKSHVATLNYDNLMYQKMIEAGILDGYTNGSLVDGFTGMNFSEEHLKRYPGNNFGYYLHLHGTPLFIEKKGVLIKQYQGSAKKTPTKHLVLSHIRHKQTIIESSLILSTYWRYLSLALRESSTIFIFGYSGCDKHLNDLIAAHAPRKNIFVIEWKGKVDRTERKTFWETELGTNEVNLIRKSNILKFTDWSQG